MAWTLEKGTPERNGEKDSRGGSNKAPYLKTDAEFKKIFGLTKDLRVCLTQIPDPWGSGKAFGSFSSLLKSSAYKKTALVGKDKERKQSFDEKSKANTFKMDHIKRRKIESAFNTVINGGTELASSQPLRSISPASGASQHHILMSCSKTREEMSARMESRPSEKQEKGTWSSNAAFEQSHSFNNYYTEDTFSVTPPDLKEVTRDEKIRRLKQVLREKEAALEEMRKNMYQK